MPAELCAKRQLNSSSLREDYVRQAPDLVTVLSVLGEFASRQAVKGEQGRHTEQITCVRTRCRGDP